MRYGIAAILGVLLFCGAGCIGMGIPRQSSNIAFVKQNDYLLSTMRLSKKRMDIPVDDFVISGYAICAIVIDYRSRYLGERNAWDAFFDISDEQWKEVKTLVAVLREALEHKRRPTIENLLINKYITNVSQNNQEAILLDLTTWGVPKTHLYQEM